MPGLLRTEGASLGLLKTKAECVPIFLATRHTLCQLGGELPAVSTRWGQEQHQLRSPQPTQQRYVGGDLRGVSSHLPSPPAPPSSGTLGKIPANKQSSCHDTHFPDGESRLKGLGDGSKSHSRGGGVGT